VSDDDDDGLASFNRLRLFSMRGLLAMRRFREPGEPGSPTTDDASSGGVSVLDVDEVDDDDGGHPVTASRDVDDEAVEEASSTPPPLGGEVGADESRGDYDAIVPGLSFSSERTFFLLRHRR